MPAPVLPGGGPRALRPRGRFRPAPVSAEPHLRQAGALGYRPEPVSPGADASGARAERFPKRCCAPSTISAKTLQPSPSPPSARSWTSRSGPCATSATARWGTATSASSPASAWRRRSSFSPIPPCRFAQSPPCWATTIPFISAAASGSTIISRPANTGGARPLDADQTKSLAATTGSVAPPSMVSTQPVI